MFFRCSVDAVVLCCGKVQSWLICCSRSPSARTGMFPRIVDFHMSLHVPHFLPKHQQLQVFIYMLKYSL
jgi:hypothetical protein